MKAKQLTILDGMILIIAISAGMTLYREYGADFVIRSEHPFERRAETLFSPRGLLNLITRSIELTLPLAFLLTPVLFTRQLRSPRPRHLILQPGFAACLVATGVLALEVCTVGLYHTLSAMTNVDSGWGLLLPSPPFIRTDNWVTRGMGIREPFPSFMKTLCRTVTFYPPQTMGAAVAGAWTILIFLGWRRERGWLGIFGRFAGVYWIAVALSVRLIDDLDRFLS